MNDVRSERNRDQAHRQARGDLHGVSALKPWTPMVVRRRFGGA
jgi:hypothetical protein